MATRAVAQPQRPVRWQLEVRGTSRDALVARLRATIPDGWYLYAMDEPPSGPVPLAVSVLGSSRMRGTPTALAPDRKADRNFNIISLVYTDSVWVSFVAERAANVSPLRATVRFQVCTDRFCLPARTDTVETNVAIAGMGSKERTAHAPAGAHLTPTETTVVAATVVASPSSVGGTIPAPGLATGTATGTATGAATVTATGASDLRAFLWLAASTGLLALLTPCVFPMVPITVGFFTRRGERRQGPAVRDAAIFAAGIVGSFAALGLGVSTVFGATRLVLLAANPVLNLAVAVLFLAFAAQLAGVWNVSLPSSVLTRLSSVTAGRRDAGALLLMGATFSLTSFTCTAPFVGSLLVLAARGAWTWPLLGLVAYATVFALPFFALALFPAAAARLPRSGPWMTTLKTVVAFAELAAVVKFVSNAGMVWGWTFVTRESVLWCWLVIATALSAWLVAQAVRAGEARARASASGHAIAALAAMIVVARLAMGLGGGSLGEMEAYLPPPRDAVGTPAGRELSWRLDALDSSLALARVAGRPVLVDFTGYTCTNCRWMEANMFTRPAVRAALERFERARLYTDGDGARYAAQQALQERLTGSVALPYYAVLDDRGVVQRAFLGMTRDEAQFLAFLETARSDGGIR